MSRRVGIWIDRNEAVLCILTGREVALERIPSEVDGRVRVSGGSRSSSPYGARDVSDEGRREARRQQQISRFNQRILERLAGAAGIVLFGPGAARRELERAIRESRSIGRLVIGSFVAERLTEPQFVARVREAFGEPARRYLPRSATGARQSI